MHDKRDHCHGVAAAAAAAGQITAFVADDVKAALTWRSLLVHAAMFDVNNL